MEDAASEYIQAFRGLFWVAVCMLTGVQKLGRTAARSLSHLEPLAGGLGQAHLGPNPRSRDLLFAIL